MFSLTTSSPLSDSDFSDDDDAIIKVPKHKKRKLFETNKVVSKKRKKSNTTQRNNKKKVLLKNLKQIRWKPQIKNMKKLPKFYINIITDMEGEIFCKAKVDDLTKNKLLKVLKPV